MAANGRRNYSWDVISLYNVIYFQTDKFCIIKSGHNLLELLFKYIYAGGVHNFLTWKSDGSIICDEMHVSSWD